MRLSKIQVLLLTPLMLAGLFGCSDNEGHSGREPITPDYDAEPAGTYTGQVLDGYLRKAVVWIDLNNNRVQDDNEPSTETESAGRFTFTKSDLGCGEETKPYSCITRPKAYPLGVKTIAGYTVDEFTRSTVERPYYLWAPPIPSYMSRVVTPFTTLLKAERDLKSYTGQQLLYPSYTPPTEAELAAEIDELHREVRNKLGVSSNLLLDYVGSNNTRLHAYARGLVWAMQDYIEAQGGLDLVTEANSGTVAQHIRQAYHYSTDINVRSRRIANVTGLPEEEVKALLDDSELDDEAKIAALVERLEPMRPKLDGLVRALVNQGRWIVQAIETAVGANAPASAYDRVDLAEVVPPIHVLERDPRVLSRKMFYVHPDSMSDAFSPLPLDGLMTLKAEQAPYKAGAALTQVQDYLYNMDGYLAQINVHGGLLEWRRDLLLSYPIQLEALFPQERWQARSLNLKALGSPTLRIDIDSSVNETGRRVTVQPQRIVEGELEPLEDAWTLSRAALEDSKVSVERVLEAAPLSLSWLKSPSRQEFGQFEEVLQEWYPAVPTALDHLTQSIALAPTRQDTAVKLNYTPSNPTERVTELGFATEGGVESRWISFDRINAGRVNATYHYQPGSETTLAEAMVLKSTIDGSVNSIQLTFSPVEGEDLFESYCVFYRYEQQYLRYEIYGRMSRGQCSNNLPFMVVEYEYAHLSELLKR